MDISFGRLLEGVLPEKLWNLPALYPDKMQLSTPPAARRVFHR
jgi:hypothetical protein